ncbi:DUF2326 domain-containing protein [Sulfurovum sp.]|jgi:hypothetical protein|uniref:DUF2326 domain-containing protein n=1 Tax=Sulfurovum sp. TaxID=1969726 RepID=UPI002A35C784|nr:DUF2326 domain-containing protein [Sulfurovum sp.]MDY0403186.1 DUF2326 domain-containing protein [Sulfurovum sp.]
MMIRDEKYISRLLFQNKVHETDELFIGTDYQYIVTVNQNQLNEVKSILTEQEYQEIIEQHTILTLTDEDDSEKLLGVKVDVGYE